MVSPQLGRIQSQNSEPTSWFVQDFYFVPFNTQHNSLMDPIATKSENSLYREDVIYKSC